MAEVVSKRTRVSGPEFNQTKVTTFILDNGVIFTSRVTRDIFTNSERHYTTRQDNAEARKVRSSMKQLRAETQEVKK